MNTLLANFERLTHLYCANNKTPAAKSLALLTRVDDGGVQSTLERRLRRATKRDPVRKKDISLRTGLEQLLEYYSLIEIASACGEVPESLPAGYVTDALLVLGNPAVQKYYEVVRPKILPQVHFARIEGKPIVEWNECNYAEFSQFFDFVNSTQPDQSSSIATFRRCLERRTHPESVDVTKNLDDTFAALDSPETFVDCLACVDDTPDVVTLTVQGLVEVLEFSRDFDAFLQSVESRILRSLFWHFFTNWFSEKSEILVDALTAAIERIETWETLTDEDFTIGDRLAFRTAVKSFELAVVRLCSDEYRGPLVARLSNSKTVNADRKHLLQQRHLIQHEASLSSAKISDIASVIADLDAPLSRAVDLIDTFLGPLGSAAETALLQMRKECSERLAIPKDTEALNLPVLLYSYASVQRLPGYPTLDYEYVASLDRVVQGIRAYLDDASQTRPLSILLLAQPGAGKTTLVQSIGKLFADKGMNVVPFNMATMQSKGDLSLVLELASKQNVPLVFLDEFDSHESNYDLLLPLLWDGRLNTGTRDMKVDKSVFILAASRAHLPISLHHAREISAFRTPEVESSKLVDLFSRINGGLLNIPPLANGADRSPDKMTIAMHLLRTRFTKLQSVPLSLLWFIARAHFRYDRRSIATLINLIPMNGNETADQLVHLDSDHIRRLPLESPTHLSESTLAFHLLSEHGARGVVELWHRANAITENQWLAHRHAEEIARSQLFRNVVRHPPRRQPRTQLPRLH